MKAMECEGCGGTLRAEGKFYICENCGTRYALGYDDEGKPFTYQPIEKKVIEHSQMAAKAERISVNEISVREIRVDNITDETVLQESLNIARQERIALIVSFLAHNEWEAAQTEINHLLLDDVNCAEAQWYNLLCEKKIAHDEQYIRLLTFFTDADKIKLDNILQNSTPSFARHIVDLFFEGRYLNDEIYSAVLSTILPYANNEVIYSKNELAEKISNAFEYAIERVFPKTFEYLLKNTLHSSEVDKYIAYLERFADRCRPILAQKYLSSILDVDPGNIVIHRKLVVADLCADISPEETIEDFEELLKYSSDADDEVNSVIGFLCGENRTTPNRSGCIWKIIGYHSGAPEALKAQLLTYANLLLQSSLWEQAKSFFNLILSFDARNADAYFGLCLVKMQARNEKEAAIVGKAIIEYPEFKKSLALYQSQKNTKRANELLKLTHSQKVVKKAKKIVLIAIAAIIAFNLLVVLIGGISYQRAYSPKNITVTIFSLGYDDNFFDYRQNNGDWSSAYDWDILLDIRNKSTLDIITINGVLSLYDELGNELESIAVSYSNIQSSASITGAVRVDVDDNTLNHSKIVFTLSSIQYSDRKEIEYDREILLQESMKAINSESDTNSEDQSYMNEDDENGHGDMGIFGTGIEAGDYLLDDIDGIDPSSILHLPYDGFVVTEVASGFDAESKLSYGDIIIGIDDVMVQDTDAMSFYLNSKKVGETVTVYFYRGLDLMQTDIVLGEEID